MRIFVLALVGVLALSPRAHAAPESPIEERFVRARALETSGAHAEAAEAYGALTSGLPAEALRDVALRRMRLLARLRRCEEARPLFEAERVLSRADRMLFADCLVRLRDRRAAIAAYRTALDAGRDDAEIRLRLADLLLLHREPSAALAELDHVWTKFPGSARDARVETLRERAGVRFRPTHEQRFLRAESWMRQRAPEEAAADLDRMPRPRSRTERAKWLHLRGMARFSTRHDYPRAAELLGEAASLGGEFAADDLFHRGRALARSDRDREGIRTFDDVVRRYGSTAVAAEAEYRAASLAWRLDAGEGVRRYRRFLGGPRARGSDFADDARFELGMALYDLREFREAAAAFTRYGDSEEFGMTRARGRYWAARARDHGQDRAGAERDYRDAIAADPLHWYALLAHERLYAMGISADPFPASTAASDTFDAGWSPALPALAAFYERLGFRDDALASLRAAESDVARSAPAGRADEALVRLYIELGGTRRAYEIAARNRAIFRRAPATVTQWAWDAAYPRPWASAVQAGAAENAHPADLVYALMRQESGYDPKVVSVADAIGLVQLLPSTARRVGEGLGLRIERDQLFEPATNIRLASRYIGTLLRMFDGAPQQLAIGAYNAGESRVAHWRTSLRTAELDEWVERIPVDQTRNYVRRVTGHWARYRYLAGERLRLPMQVTRSR
jgi:soluble lytic murein transglycosylase